MPAPGEGRDGGPEAAVVRALRPYVLLLLAWAVSTAQVLSGHSGPDSVGPSASEQRPAFKPGVMLMQPVYTMFYTLVFSSLFSMAWMEFDERFGGRGDGGAEECQYFHRDSMERFAFLKDQDSFYHFVFQNALVCAVGLALAVIWGVYLRRFDPPSDHSGLRRSVLYYCLGQLLLCLTVFSSYSSFVAPHNPRDSASGACSISVGTG